MTESVPRSPRAERARLWFWCAFGVAFTFGTLVHFGLDALNHGWWLLPRWIIVAVAVVSGAVWGWEKYKRRAVPPPIG